MATGPTGIMVVEEMLIGEETLLMIRFSHADLGGWEWDLVEIHSVMICSQVLGVEWVVQLHPFLQ